MKHLLNRLCKRNELRVNKIVFLMVMIFMVLLPATPVHAADLVGSCVSLLKGTWSSNVCTIPVGNTGEVPSGVTLGVALGETIDVKGTLNINGILELQGGTLSNNGTTNNNGTINNYSPPTAQQYGLKNYSTLNNNGSILITETTTLYNYGVFINADTKAANLNIKGEFDNRYTPPYSGAFTNKASGLLNITVNGAYLAAQYTSTTNYGEIKIDGANAEIDIYSLTNHGTINNLGGTFQAVDLTNSNTGILYNDIYSNWTCGNSDWSKLTNEGSFTNRYIFNINHKCVFTNNSGATLDNQGNTYIGETNGDSPSGTLLNQGSVSNTGKIILMGWGVDSGVRLHNDNSGVITNVIGSVIELDLNTKLYNTGLIEHKGVIQPGSSGSGVFVNSRWESPYEGDPGIINKYCAGSITLPSGNYFGPAPVNMCTGTIVIRKDTVPDGPTNFSFSGGLGTFSLDDDSDGTLPNERTFSGLTPGTYSVTEAAATGYSLTSLTCNSTGDDWDTTTVNQDTRTATIDLDGDINETVTCIFTNTVICTPPAVTSHPVNQTITYGSNASFSVNGTNYTSVQWQVNSGSGWTNISGASSTTYTLTKPAVSLSGSQYRAVLTGGCTPTATSNTAMLTVNQAPVTATAGSYNSTYDGFTHSPSACAVTGAYTGDLSCTNNPATVGPAVGSGTISPSVNGTGLSNYTITSINGSWSITAKPVTANVTFWDKGYDGTTTASIFMCTLIGVESSDSVTCDFSSASANFDNKNAGTGKTVSATGLTLTGADAGNYSFVGTGSGTASILALPINGSFTASDKVYNGTTAATVLTRRLSVAVSGDDVYMTGGTATFSDKNVGTGKTVTLSGAALSGTDAGNYILDSVATTTADISPAVLTASISVENKTYDGTANATVTACMLTGVVSGESVTCDYASVSASFPDMNVGENKVVSATGLTLSGADKSNYAFNGTGSGTASITAVHITGSFMVDDKVYDGTTAATVNSRSLSGVVSGDSVSLTGGTATFSDKNVGTGKAVTLAGASLTGTDAGNYILDSVTSTTASIQAASLTATISANNKVYDGLTDAIVTSCSLNGLASGDYVTCTFSSTDSASFSDKNVGTDKTVTLSGASLSGTDAGNYMLTSPVTTTADITQRLINVNPVSGQFKVYGDAEPTLIYTVAESGLAAGDSFSGALGRYQSEDVGFYDITLGTLSIIDGNGGANYNLGLGVEVQFEIKPKHITGSFTAKNKVYDGTTAATVTLRELNDVLGEDAVSLSGGTATFSDKNVGNDKTVTLTGASLIGTDAGNYVLDSVATTTADITKCLVIVRPVSEQFKIYGDAEPTLTYTVDEPGLVGGDSFSGAPSRDQGEDVGFYEIRQGTLAINDGNGGANYNMGFSIEVEFQIKPKHITGSFTTEDKVYDGTTAATLLSHNLSGVLAGDLVSLSGGTASFSDKNVGEGKTVTLTGTSLIGADAGNYVLDSVATTTADITKRLIIVRPVSGQFKIYGDADPTLTYTVDEPGLASDDSFTGTLSRDQGEDVGFYEIRPGTLAINDGNGGANYNLGFIVEVEFEIKPIQEPIEGELRITKTFDPLTSGFTDSFTIAYDCDDGTDHDGNVTLSAGGSETISGIPIGTTCTVSEDNLPTAPTGWTFGTPTFTPESSSVTVSEASPAYAEVVVTNTISRDLGNLRISKEFDPLTSGFTDTFTIAYDCDDGTAHDGTVNLAAGESTTISGIPTGTTCTVSEDSLPTAPIGWTFGEPAYYPENGSVTITASASSSTSVMRAVVGAEVTVTNTISRDLGELKITKIFDPLTSGFSGTFTIAYDCDDGTDHDGTVQLAAGESTTISGIPTGTTCMVSEGTLPTPPEGWVFLGPIMEPKTGVVIINEVSPAYAEVTVTNTISQESGNWFIYLPLIYNTESASIDEGQ